MIDMSVLTGLRIMFQACAIMAVVALGAIALEAILNWHR